MSRSLPAHPNEDRTQAIEPGLSRVLMMALPFAYGPIYQHVNMCPDDDPKDGPAPYEEVEALHVNKLSNAVMESDWMRQKLDDARQQGYYEGLEEGSNPTRGSDQS